MYYYRGIIFEMIMCKHLLIIANNCTAFLCCFYRKIWIMYINITFNIFIHIYNAVQTIDSELQDIKLQLKQQQATHARTGTWRFIIECICEYILSFQLNLLTPMATESEMREKITAIPTVDPQELGSAARNIAELRKMIEVWLYYYY